MPTMPPARVPSLTDLIAALETSKPGDIPNNRLADGTEVIYREDGTFVGLRHTGTVTYPFWKNRG